MSPKVAFPVEDIAWMEDLLHSIDSISELEFAIVVHNLLDVLFDFCGFNDIYKTWEKTMDHLKFSELVRAQNIHLTENQCQSGNPLKFLLECVLYLRKLTNTKTYGIVHVVVKASVKVLQWLLPDHGVGCLLTIIFRIYSQKFLNDIDFSSYASEEFGWITESSTPRSILGDLFTYQGFSNGATRKLMDHLLSLRSEWQSQNVKK